MRELFKRVCLCKVRRLGSRFFVRCWVLGAQVVVGSELKRDLLETELGLLATVLIGLDDVSVLIVEAPLVQLSVVHVEARADLLHSAQVSRIDPLGCHVLNLWLFAGSGDSRMEQAGLPGCNSLRSERSCNGARLRVRLRTAKKVGLVTRARSVPITIGQLSCSALHDLGDGWGRRLTLILSGKVALELLPLLGVIALVHVEDELDGIDSFDEALQLAVVRVRGVGYFEVEGEVLVVLVVPPGEDNEYGRLLSIALVDAGANTRQ